MSDTTMQTEPGESATPPPPVSLKDQQKALQNKSQQQAVDQVDATLAELKKVLEEQAKALIAYTPEIISELTEAQDALSHKFGHLKTLLEGDLGSVKDWVIQTIDQSNTALSDAHAALDAMLDTPVHRATKALAVAEKERDDAVAVLTKWRKPIAAIKTRQKAAGDLVKEITALATPEAHKHGEAYWKLGLDGTKPVAGQPYLKQLIDGEPAVVAAADLPGQIQAAWDVFQQKRTAAELAALDLIAAQDALKGAESDVADKQKNQIPNIAEVLGDWEDHKTS